MKARAMIHHTIHNYHLNSVAACRSPRLSRLPRRALGSSIYQRTPSMQFSDDVSEDALCSKNWVPLAQAAFSAGDAVLHTSAGSTELCCAHLYQKCAPVCTIHKKYAHAPLGAHFGGCTLLVHTLGRPQRLFANFSWPPGHLTHTF